MHLAREHSVRPVLHQDFLSLDVPTEAFDGVFANACLFQVPGQELPRVLQELLESLRLWGVLFASNPQRQLGRVQRRPLRRLPRWPAWKACVKGAGFETIGTTTARRANCGRNSRGWPPISEGRASV